MSGSDFAALWQELEARLLGIFQRFSKSEVPLTNDERKGLSDLYTRLTVMCTDTNNGKNYKDDLYLSFRELVRNYYSKVGTSLSSLRGEELLRETGLQLKKMAVTAKWLLFAFDYLNRYYPDRVHKPQLEVVSTMALRDTLYTTLKGQLRDAVLYQIEQERTGQVVDNGLLGPVLSLFMSVGVEASTPWRPSLAVYREDFEAHFLEATREFFQREAQDWASRGDSCSEYLEKAEKRLRQEESRVSLYLAAESRDRLLTTVQDVLLREQQGRLIHMEQTGFLAMLTNDRREDLKRVFRLFSRIDTGDSRAETGLGPIAAIFQDFVSRGTMELHSAEETGMAGGAGAGGGGAGGGGGGAGGGASSEPDAYIRRVVEIHDRYLSLVSDCFSNSHLFQKALKDAFESTFNKPVRGATTAELLATYFDRLLRSSKGRIDEGISTDAEVENVIEKLVRLFGYISEKDRFSEFYRKLLAKRLLMNKSESEETERIVIAKLKFSYGATFTSKLEGMINDMNQSKNRLNEFNDFAKNRLNGVVMEVHVLQMNYWPTYKQDGLKLHDAMLSLMQVFQGYYSSKHNSRKLQWVHSLGTVTLKATYGNRSYDVSLSTYPACILLLFNKHATLTAQAISQELQLSPDDTKRSIAAISLSKHKLLSKSLSGGNISMDEEISVNNDFSDKLVRIKIPNVNSKLTQEEVKTTSESVDTDRQYLVDAAVVRIMKSRKQLSHPQLVSEAIDHLKRFFNPPLLLLKKRIEDLISRDYLRRSATDRTLYEYVA